jgi:hypothetical protein
MGSSAAESEKKTASGEISWRVIVFVSILILLFVLSFCIMARRRRSIQRSVTRRYQRLAGSDSEDKDRGMV